MQPMRVILQSVLCGAKVATLGAHVACSCSVLGLNVVVQVGRLGHQVAHLALPLPAPQTDHQGPDGSLDICDVRLL